MATLHIEHEISDFDTWKAAFDRDPVGRQRSGVRQHRIARPVDDPRRVIIDLDFDGASEASAFLSYLQRDVWQTSIKSPALVGSPKTLIVETVESETY